ncbi:helix-turn-helix domain-containing protein [Enterocloster clostridioformis]
MAQAIEQAGGNKTKAARILGIHRSTIWRYIKKFGMK